MPDNINIFRELAAQYGGIEKDAEDAILGYFTDGLAKLPDATRLAIAESLYSELLNDPGYSLFPEIPDDEDVPIPKVSDYQPLNRSRLLELHEKEEKQMLSEFIELIKLSLKKS